MILPLLLAIAASAAEPSLVLSRPAKAVLNERIELKPIAGHHFNIEAPQKCGKNKADEVTPRVFRCRLASSGEIEVLASVCDDAKTFCRQERFTVAVSGKKKDAQRTKLTPKPHPFAAGFLVNEPGKAVTLSRRAHEPIFVHFYGIWCPPCNLLEEGVYPTLTFQKASEGFVLLALDADAELSWDWKARFKVGGYPTLLVLDERGQEVSRALGYRSPEALAAFLLESKALMSEPVEIAALAVSKSSPTEDGARRARVARWRFERGEYAEAVSAAGAAPESRRESLLARKELASKSDDAPAVLAALKALTAEYKGSVEFADWVSDLVERDKPAAEALLAEALASTARWAADPKLSEHGYVPGDMRATEASLFESFGKEAEAKAAWSVAADAYGTDAKASTLKLARGANLERAFSLAKAGRLAEARALYDSLVGAYPDEFTFHYGYARLLLEQNELPAALISARAAVKTGYGDNWLRAVAIEAKTLKAMGLKEEAAKSLDAALTEAAAPKSAAVRTHRYLAELRKLRSEL
jgi:thiol-disulfide isomerase/thioredoxin